MHFRIKPVQRQDYARIMELATIAGIGMSSLPQDEGVLKAKIESAVRSFAGNPVQPKEEIFLFVLEDMVSGTLVGTAAILAHVGLSRPFYSYKVSTISQASAGVGVYSYQNVLHMVNDYTGASELGSLFVHPDFRRDGIGRFLSRSRYMMLAEFEHLFSDIVISEIRGVQDESGNSPFYDNLARHFFKMEFKKADYIYATQGGQFIADLMPKYPIYVNLLPKAAQEVIGVPFEASRPAMHLLKKEGFNHEGYVDLFDAGPTVQANRHTIKTVRESRKGKIVALGKLEAPSHLICNTGKLSNFMVTMGPLEMQGEDVVITPQSAKALGVKVGDTVRYAL